MIEQYLRDLVSIASYDGQEEAVADYLVTQLRDFKTHRLVVDTYSEHGRSVALLPDDPVLLLDAHLDTVPPGDMAKWNSPPLTLTDTGDTWTGLGTMDDKGNIAICLELLHTIDCSRVGFVFPGGEEVRAEGLEHLFTEKLLPQADLAISLEASDLKVHTAHKGAGHFHVEVRGKAFHSSMPERGINAVEQAATLVGAISSRDNPCIRSHPQLGNTTMSVVKMHGGDLQNRIPDLAVIDIDARMLPEQTAEQFTEYLNRLIKDKGIDGTAICKEYLPPMEFKGDEKWLDRLQAAGAGERTTAPFWTHAAYYDRAGTPAVVFGPIGSGAHAPNETLSKQQTQQAYDILQNLIYKL